MFDSNTAKKAAQKCKETKQELSAVRKKVHQFNIWLSKEEWEFVKSESKQKEISIASYFRMCVFGSEVGI